MLQIVTRLLLFANLCTICLTLELTLRFAPSIHKIRSHLEANCKFHSLHCNVHCDFVSTFTFREWSMFLRSFNLICQTSGHWSVSHSLMSGQGYYLYQLFGDACMQASTRDQLTFSQIWYYLLFTPMHSCISGTCKRQGKYHIKYIKNDIFKDPP